MPNGNKLGEKVVKISEQLLGETREKRTLTILRFLTQFEKKPSLNIFEGDISYIRGLALTILTSSDKKDLEESVSKCIRLVEQFEVLRETVHQLLEKKSE